MGKSPRFCRPTAIRRTTWASPPTGSWSAVGYAVRLLGDVHHLEVGGRGGGRRGSRRADRLRGGFQGHERSVLQHRADARINPEVLAQPGLMNTNLAIVAGSGHADAAGLLSPSSISASGSRLAAGPAAAQGQIGRRRPSNL